MITFQNYLHFCPDPKNMKLKCKQKQAMLQAPYGWNEHTVKDCITPRAEGA